MSEGASLQAHGPAADRQPSSIVTISGAVKTPGRFDVTSLKQMPPSTLTVNGSVYTGVDLWALLSNTVGIAADPAAMNGSVGLVIVATGTDGYSAVLSLAEIDPAFWHRPVLLAYGVDGAGLGRNGAVRLIVGGDAKMGRSVSNLATLEVQAVRPRPRP